MARVRCLSLKRWQLSGISLGVALCVCCGLGGSVAEAAPEELLPEQWTPYRNLSSDLDLVGCRRGADGVRDASATAAAANAAMDALTAEARIAAGTKAAGCLACALGCQEHEAALAESFEPWWDHKIPAGTALMLCDKGGRASLNFIAAISRGQVFMRCCSTHGGECDAEFGLTLLQLLAEIVAVTDLPDMYFNFNVGDQPFIDKAYWSPVPQFHWVRSEGHWGIPFPSPYHLRSHGEGKLGDERKHRRFHVPWEKKIAKAFFRGALSAPDYFSHLDLDGIPRVRLLNIAKQHPELFDVAMTSVDNEMMKQLSQERQESLLQRFGRTGMVDLERTLPKYRYVLCISAVLSSWRVVELLRSGSVLLLQDDMTREVMYEWLTPWEHYVPVRKTLSDLVQKLQWLEEHQEQARIIAENALDFFERRIRRQDTYCYLWQVLRALADASELEKVPSPRRLERDGWRKVAPMEDDVLRQLLKQAAAESTSEL